MTTRRTGLITALLLTAALLLSMPGLMRFITPADSNRMDERLRPARLRTLTVWLLPGDMGDREVITRACAAFEKQTPGVRVFLRVVTADEFSAQDAVLPDVALFETGSLSVPEKLFLPLADTGESSGQFGGTAYALPLWMHVSVLSIPRDWFGDAAQSTPRPASLLASAAPVPENEAPLLLDSADLPWPLLLQPGALIRPSGVALQQLLLCCPQSLRSDLIAERTLPSPTPLPGGLETTLPISQGTVPPSPTRPASPARVQTLRAHWAALRNGQSLCGCVLSPAVSDQARYAALCRNGEDAVNLLRFLLEQNEAASYGFLPAQGGDSADALMQAALTLYAVRTLPNAFAHTREELLSLCADAFRRGEDPVETLLHLR